MTATIARTSPLAAIGLFMAATLHGADFPNPLPPEPLMTVATLPEHYPDTWTLLNFNGDHVEIRNVGDDGREVKGQLQARDSATVLLAAKRPEIYVADTVWARGLHGTRTDFITIYDKRTLNPIDEIVLPTKRALMTAMEGMFAFTDEERLGLVFDFTPASSVTVVDLVKRKVLGEVEIPGCSLLYPSGKRGFSTLCASGTLLTVHLGADGKAAGRSESQPFNHLDDDPLFTYSANFNGVHYFPTMLGHVQPIDMSGEEVKIGAAWSLVSPQEAAQNWRPSGWQPVSGDGDKLLYVLMQPDGHEGTHKDPGTEVWVFDVAAQKRVQRLRLVREGSSIALTHAAKPLLLVQTNERLDVYDPASGALVRSSALTSTAETGFYSRISFANVN